MVFEHHHTIQHAYSIKNKTFGARCEVTTIWRGKNIEFIHDDLQRRTRQMMSFSVWWKFEEVVYKELFPRSHYYNKVLGTRCFHDLIHNTMVSLYKVEY